jgi:hypothetical protein
MQAIHMRSVREAVALCSGGYSDIIAGYNNLGATYWATNDRSTAVFYFNVSSCI